MLFRSEAEDPVSGEVDSIYLKVDYQWTPIRCVKYKKFGHDCARLHSIQHIALKTSRPSSSHQQRSEEGVWKVIEKGKGVVDQDQSYIPSPSFMEGEFHARSAVPSSKGQKAEVEVFTTSDLPKAMDISIPQEYPVVTSGPCDLQNNEDSKLQTIEGHLFEGQMSDCTSSSNKHQII